jgi:DNA-directed RNA polymerase subunit beta'
VLAIYASQGQKLNAKHIEVIVRQMFSRVYVKDAGETELLPGQIVDRYRAEEENEQLGTKGKVTQADLQPLFMGITKVALSTESFLSAASFMETARVLINAAVTGKIDRLEGLKENVIIGRLTPAGTGFGVNPAELEREYEKNAGTVSPSA